MWRSGRSVGRRTSATDMGTAVGMANSSRWTSTSSWRSAPRALCSRVLTAPGRVPRRPATSAWLSPPRWKSATAARWPAGSAAIAARTRSAICAASAASCGPGPGAGGSAAVGARPARALLQRAPAQVEPDPDQPRPEALGIAQPVEADEGGDDRLLRGVGGELGVAGRPAAGGEQHAVVALDERREGAAIAAASGGHEVGIGCVATGHDGACS